jgi:quinolinate synthase
MADMAAPDQPDSWRDLARWASGRDVIIERTRRLIPVNHPTSAAIKAFVGKHGGIVCTSTNARQP